MRLKHVKGAEEAMLTSKFITQEPEKLRGNWAKAGTEETLTIENETATETNHSASASAQPPKLFVEIGMGKGQFITTLAQQDPANIYIGIEKFSSVLIRGLQKQEELQLPNLRLIRMDAEAVTEIFAPGEVDVIYLNFSDPWPKDRHAKRRLTSPQFLERYTKILKPEGHIEFKTDNMELFDFSVESIKESGWEITAITRDLHADPVLSEGNVMTEYEERFSSQGNPIAKVIARPV